MDKKESLVSKIIWGMMDELEVDNDILTNGYIELKVKEIEQEIDRAREEEREEIVSELEAWKVVHIDRTREDGAEYLRDALIKLLTI